MHSLQFDKHELINAFPPHVRDKCLRTYENARQEVRGHMGRDTQDEPHPQSVNAYRDEHAEEIWEDGHQKAEWTHRRAQDA